MTFSRYRGVRVLNRRITVACLVAAIGLPTVHAVENPPVDSALNPAQKKTLESVNATFLPLSCCGSATLKACLAQSRPCDLAVRLEKFGAWLIGRNMPGDSVGNMLMQRRDCLTSTEKYEIDMAGYPVAGSAKAPVVIVAYMSAMCPVCKRLVTELRQDVTAGALKGKAVLVAKPFGTSTADHSLFAAARLNAFWPFVEALHRHAADREDERLFRAIADSLKLPAAQYDAFCHEKSVDDLIQRSRQEATDNGVTVTPTFFIGNLRYHSYKDVRWVVDAAEYLWGQGKR